MRIFIKNSLLIFFIIPLLFTKGYSQDCSVNFFFRSYTGGGFNTGGSQDDRLTILADSSMIMYNPRMVARLYKNGEVAWGRYLVSYGGKTMNAVADYDGAVICAFNNNITKIDTAGNVVYQKKMTFEMDNGYDITYSESLKDIAILDNGDKMVLYEDGTGRYGGYLFRFDKDMTTVKWCKNIRYNNNINFTNMIIDGRKIVLAGVCQEDYYSAPFCFVAAVDSADGSLSRAGYFSFPNLGSINRLYKGNGQYFLTAGLLNQADSFGQYCYIRVDSSFHLTAIRRIAGYTDFWGASFTLAPQNDNSLLGIIGPGLSATIFRIDQQDSVKWFKAYLAGYPHDIKQNTEALFFAADMDYNAVGVGARSTFTIYKTDYNGNSGGNCRMDVTTSFATDNYYSSSVTPASTLQLSNKTGTIGSGTASFNNYPLDTYGCNYTSVCNAVKLIGDTAVCSNMVRFTGRRSAGCQNPVNWSVSPAADFTLLNDSTISVKFTSNGNYKIITRINDPCNEYSDSVTVHVNLSAFLGLPADSIICAGNTLKLSAGNHFQQYEWQDGSTDSIFTVTQPGRYHIKVKDYCGNIYSDSIDINPAGFYFSIGNDTIKCNTDSLLLKATPGFYNYQWPLQYNLKKVNDSTVMVNPLMDTLYIATAEKMPGCFVKDTIHVTVLHSAPVWLGNDTSLCTGQSLLLDAGNNFTHYNWSTGDVSGTITVNNIGTYFVKATAANGCSSNDTLKILQVYPLPVFSLGNDTTLCQGQQLSWNVNLTAATYLWNNGSMLHTRVIQDSGQYWLTVTQQGCSNTDTIRVSYKPSPAVYLGQDSVLCNGFTKQLNAFNNNATYRWQDGSNNASYLVTATGLYSVVVNINGCMAGDSVNITYKSKPLVSLVTDTAICRGQELLLKAVAAAGDHYVWQDGSSNSSLLVKEPGTYLLTATNECGITTSPVNVTPGTCELYMPAAFTPDNNGINDLFRVKNVFAVKEFSFIIYNRFGEVIFESNNIYTGWDGSYRGTPQNAGTYVWMISFKDADNIKKFAKGTVLLIR